MLSIIIAAYNEESRIGESLLKIKEYLDGRDADYEIIIVDDGSTDNTRQVAADYKSEITNLRVIGYPINKGKGYALRQGVFASKGEAVLLTDADLSTPIEELARLLPLITGCEYDVVIGSRALQSSKILKKQPWWRQGMGKIFNRIVGYLFWMISAIPNAGLNCFLIKQPETCSNTHVLTGLPMMLKYWHWQKRMVIGYWKRPLYGLIPLPQRSIQSLILCRWFLI